MTPITGRPIRLGVLISGGGTTLANFLMQIRAGSLDAEVGVVIASRPNCGGIAKAALTRHLNAGNRVAAADAFLNWRRPASIIPRREAERDLFRHGRYPGGTIPVWFVDRTGRVDFSRPIRRLTEDEALALARGPSQAPPVLDPVPHAPTGWLARLAAFFSTLIRRA